MSATLFGASQARPVQFVCTVCMHCTLCCNANFHCKLSKTNYHIMHVSDSINEINANVFHYDLHAKNHALT